VQPDLARPGKEHSVGITLSLNGNHEMYTLRGSTLLRLLDAGDFACAAD